MRYRILCIHRSHDKFLVASVSLCHTSALLVAILYPYSRIRSNPTHVSVRSDGPRSHNYGRSDNGEGEAPSNAQ